MLLAGQSSRTNYMRNSSASGVSLQHGTQIPSSQRHDVLTTAEISGTSRAFIPDDDTTLSSKVAFTPATTLIAPYIYYGLGVSSVSSLYKTPDPTSASGDASESNTVTKLESFSREISDSKHTTGSSYSGPDSSNSTRLDHGALNGSVASSVHSLPSAAWQDESSKNGIIPTPLNSIELPNNSYLGDSGHLTNIKNRTLLNPGPSLNSSELPTTTISGHHVSQTNSSELELALSCWKDWNDYTSSSYITNCFGESSYLTVESGIETTTVYDTYSLCDGLPRASATGLPYYTTSVISGSDTDVNYVSATAKINYTLIETFSPYSVWVQTDDCRPLWPTELLSTPTCTIGGKECSILSSMSTFPEGINWPAHCSVTRTGTDNCDQCYLSIGPIQLIYFPVTMSGNFCGDCELGFLEVGQIITLLN